MAEPSPLRVILELLAAREGSWTLGLDMVRASDGRLSRGTIYVHLLQLEDAHHVLARGPRFDGRFEYQITSTGRAALLRDDL
jgi:DNA-binding PadR family transcriptional regulator